MRAAVCYSLYLLSVLCASTVFATQYADDFHSEYRENCSGSPGCVLWICFCCSSKCFGRTVTCFLCCEQWQGLVARGDAGAAETAGRRSCRFQPAPRGTKGGRSRRPATAALTTSTCGREARPRQLEARRGLGRGDRAGTSPAAAMRSGRRRPECSGLGPGVSVG